ncbi:MAG TPA: glycosyltransferase family 9 protein [Phycisphaerae bacterium]|nr:glycosyltransferase family 9 protein [Phycisphaerae bacterium]
MPAIRISVVHQAALGDTVLLIPLFRSLRQHFQQDGAAITVVTRSNLGQMLTMLGFVDNYASADDREHTAWFAPPEEGSASANSAPAWADCDVLISAVSSGTDAWAANAARSAARRRVFFSPRPAAEYPQHVTAFHREQLAAGDLDLPAAPLPLPRSNPDGAIVIHPGSGGDAKCWPRERFLGLARSLKRLGYPPTLILGEAEQERWGNKIIDELQGEFAWYLHMGLYELADRLSRARLYLGNDSGVTHLAAAMGIPTVALFGPSDDRQWAPVGPGVQILRPAAPASRDLQALEEETVLHALLADLRRMD